MSLKENAGPIAIAAAVVVLAGLLFFLTRTQLAERPHNVSRDNAPAYAKQSGMVETGGTPTRPRTGPAGGAPTTPVPDYARRSGTARP